MMASNLSAQLNFITDAAHLLAATAPETSAHLMSRQTASILNGSLPLSDAQRQHVCTSCGHIMIPGQGTTLRFASDKAVQGGNKKSGSKGERGTRHHGISKVFTCGLCLRETKISFPPPSPLVRNKAKNMQRASSQSNEAQKPSANASSKKRAKSRKAGLQALLEQNQASATKVSGHGLNLSDFMKKT